MVYIISGASRSGKSKAAELLLKKHNIPFMPTDAVMMGFFNGVESSDIHPELWPDVIARKMWGFLKNFIITMIENDMDYCIEGEAILPELLIELTNKYPKDIKVVFIGFAEIKPLEKVAHVKTYADKNDWLIGNDDDYINNHIKNMIQYSNMIKKEALKYNYKYIDTSSDFTKSVEEVIHFLME